MSAKSLSSRSRGVVAFAVPLLLCGVPAGLFAQPAQTPPVTAQESPEQLVLKKALSPAFREEITEIRTRRTETRLVYPFGLSGTPQSGATLVAGTENKRVSLTATFATSPLTELALIASAPLSEDDPRTTVVQLDGLANKSTFAFEWRYGQHRLPSEAALTALVGVLWDECQKVGAKPGKPAGGDPGVALEGCSLADLEKASPRATAEVRRLFPRRLAWFVSIAGKVGTEKYTFVDPSSFDERDERKWGKSGSITVGALLPQNLYAAAELRIENAHEASKNMAVCAIDTVGVKGACPLMVVGPPSPDDGRVISAELRRYVTVVQEHNIGVSGILRRDWHSDETSLELPVYFVRDKEGGLSGGVSYGHVWSPKEGVQGHRFAVFVGQTFRLGAGS